ncbi:MAG TPA: hypothetical protein DD383_06165, partial [Rikenellaceae bacterium]|nr:hypothetical protein [Rikenellaceae bacterium]
DAPSPLPTPSKQHQTYEYTPEDSPHLIVFLSTNNPVIFDYPYRLVFNSINKIQRYEFFVRKAPCLTHESIKIAFWCVTEPILRTKSIISIFAMLRVWRIT